MKLKETVCCPSPTLATKNEHGFSGYCDRKIAACRWTLTSWNNLFPCFKITRLAKLFN